MEIITTFDYGQLDTETRIVVKQRTLEIRAQVKHSAHAIADIGEKLIDVRSKLPEGGFSAWLKAEFDWTKMTAYRFIRVAEQFGSNNLLLDNAAPAALYVLSDPSTSESIRQEFIEEAEAGKPVTHKDVKARKKTGGISKRTIEPLVADTAPVGYHKNQQTWHPSKAAYSSSDNQTGRGDDISQVAEDDIDQTGSPKHHKSQEEQAAIGLLEALGYSIIPPEAADDPTCTYCGKPF